MLLCAIYYLQSITHNKNKMCNRMVSIGCCMATNIFYVVAVLLISTAASHFYVNLKVFPPTQPIPYFKGPLVLTGKSIAESNISCSQNPVTWTRLPSGYHQQNGDLTWEHGHPMTAMLRTLPSGSIRGELSAKTLNYEVHFNSTDATPNPWFLHISQNSSLSLLSNADHDKSWELTFMA